MNAWRVRHEGSPVSSPELTFAQVLPPGVHQRRLFRSRRTMPSSLRAQLAQCSQGVTASPTAQW